MWYLQTETLALLCLWALGAGLARTYAPKLALFALPSASFCLIWYVSRRLAVLMAAYLLVGFVCCRLLSRFKSRALLLVFCAGAALPLAAARSGSLGVELPFVLVTLGMMFHLLRLIDLFSHANHSPEPVCPLNFLNYMLFLPAFSAGPMIGYSDFVQTLAAPQRPDSAAVTYSFKRIIRGLFKKVALAAPLTHLLTLVAERSGPLESLCTIVLSYLVLYFDLSGYTDIAVALGRLAGFSVPENFDRPWLAQSFSRLWQSWHMTVYGWMRGRVSRLFGAGSALTAFFTLALMGVWHGFSLPFIAAGVYSGLLLAAETLLPPPKPASKPVARAARAMAVNALFAVSTLPFFFEQAAILRILRSLVIW